MGIPKPILCVKRDEGPEAECHYSVEEVDEIHGPESVAAQEPQGDEWCVGVFRVVDEEDERHNGDGLRDQESGRQHRGTAAEKTDSEHRGQQQRAEQGDADEVEFFPKGRDALRKDEQRQHQEDESDRDIHEKDGPPRPICDEDPAENGADDSTDGKNAREHSERPVAVSPEVVGDDSGCGGHEGATAEGLQAAQGDEHVDVGCDSATERRHGEHGDRDDEDFLPAQHVAQLPGERHHHQLAERIDRYRPAAPLDSAMEFSLDGRERGRDDRLVDRGHEKGDRDDEEGPARVGGAAPGRGRRPTALRSGRLRGRQKLHRVAAWR
ncbi:MAG: hypothetical protein WDM88_02750 [Galbitalea sp.]